MKRTTYLLAALSISLASGILLLLGLNARPAPQNADPTIMLASASATLTRPSNSAEPFWVTRPPQAPFPIEPTVHDPVLIKEGDSYYVFYTGGMINALRSKDLLHWDRFMRIVPQMPAWATQAVPGNRNDLWAPDISFYKGRFHLYYSVSTFGSRVSAIGLATNKTLNPAAPDYQWQDEGPIVRSQNADNFNAIDPNFVLDEKGEPWLNFGSFWTGIKLLKLGPDGKPDPNHKTLYSLAARAPGTTAIEAPCIIREGKYFYLFVSWDTCCQGVRSTYRIMVGRAEKITGPYRDKDKVDMAQGGGTQLLAGDGQRLIGPGHQGLFKDGDRWLMVHHFYDGTTNGTARLQIRPLTFDAQGWPVLGKPLNTPP